MVKKTEKMKDQKYNLWRNLREYLKRVTLSNTDEKTLGDKFDEWTVDFISPTEANCMIKQTTACTDAVRLKVKISIQP
jgi:hypothetical protein